MNMGAARIVSNLCLSASLMLGPMAAQAVTVLWGSSSEGKHPGSIFRIDATTGTGTLIGANGFDNKVSDVAVDPQTGVLYGILGSACTGARLITIDQDTGAATLVGIIKGEGFDGTLDSDNGCPGGSDALTFGLDGTLYAGGWNGGTDGGKILTVDKTSGDVLRNEATDVVKGSPLPAHIAGLATGPDGRIWVSRGNNVAGTLHTIDPATGHFTSRIKLSRRRAVVSDLAFDEEGTLYGSIPNRGKLVTIRTSGYQAGKIEVIGRFRNREKIAGLALLGEEVSAADCAGDEGGCNPTGGMAMEMPADFEVPQGATITQKRLTLSDPRAAAGRCGREPLILFGDEPDVPDLVIPEYLCGSPDFVVLITESDLQFESGTMITTNEPGAFFADPLPCDSPISGDPQQQDVVVWQPTDSSEIEEGHALELTFECGSSRGRTKGLSYYVVGMHIDFGIDWNADPHTVRQAFIDLTHAKFHGLLRAVVDARGVLPREDFNKLVLVAGLAKVAFALRLYEAASHKISLLIDLLEESGFAAGDDFNHSGNIEMRAYNVRFMIDEKVVDLMN